MNNADEDATRKNIPEKSLIAVSRDAVQTAEDARTIAVKKMDDVRLANERQASADAQAQTQAQADEANRQKDRHSLTRKKRNLTPPKRSPIWLQIRLRQPLPLARPRRMLINRV